ncbi:unnamed protein product, partial [Dracunculus medinensis]|uniref:Glycosyltransferase family 92 protein n=1 Tax=Dracunculus medinensis TaxID=318479 RepID=A0A0N4U7X8_DRAME
LIFQANFVLILQNDWLNISRPELLKFDSLGAVKLENYIWPEGQRSKVIMIPERIIAAHVHTVTSVVAKTRRIVIQPDIALVFHLRFFCLRFISTCNIAWEKRLKHNFLSTGANELSLPNRGVKVSNFYYFISSQVLYFVICVKLCIFGR